MPNELGTTIIPHLPAERISVKHRLGHTELGWEWIGRLQRHRCPHLCLRFFAVETAVAARNFPVTKLNQQPARHVVRADRDPARRRGVAGKVVALVQAALIAQTAQRAINPRVRLRSIRSFKANFVVPG